MDRRARIGAVLALLAWLALGALWPGPGADYVNVRRANLALSVAAAALVLARAHGLIRQAGHEARALVALAAVSVAVYTHLFALRVHYHEFAHYYLSSKYFGELGYGTLYTALLRAEAESSGGRLSVAEARDLAGSGALAPAGALLAKSQPVKDAFSPERWDAFVADAAFVRARLGPHYAAVLSDHGFNASPLWAALGGALARRVPAGPVGFGALAALDLLLLAATFGALGRVFGSRAALLALVHFCAVYGATYEWVGGAFLRYLWFAATALAFCAFARAEAAAGGALLGLAAALRVFPALFLGAVVLGAIGGWRRSRFRAAEAARAVGGFAAAVALLVALTAFSRPGLAAWPAFVENLSRHAATPLANLVGLRSAVSTLLVSAGVVTDAPTLGSILGGMRLVAWPAAALGVAWGARRRDLAGAAALGMALVFAFLDLTAYYYAFLVFLTVVERDRPRVVAGALAVEAATHALALGEGRSAVLFAHRSVLVFALFAAAWFLPRRARTGVVPAAASA